MRLQCDRRYVEGKHPLTLDTSLLRFLLTIVPLRLIYMGMSALGLETSKVPICFFHPSCTCKKRHSLHALRSARVGDGHEWLNAQQLLDDLGIRSVLQRYWSKLEKPITVPDDVMFQYKLNNYLPLFDITSCGLWHLTCNGEVEPIDALFTCAACRRFLNEGHYMWTVLQLYEGAGTAMERTQRVLSKTCKAPSAISCRHFSASKFHRALQQALSLYGRHPDSGYLTPFAGKWDDPELLAEAGTTMHRFAVWMARVQRSLLERQEANATPLELLIHIFDLLDFVAEDGFICYQVELSYRVYLRSASLQGRRACTKLLPFTRRVAGPGMIPFCMEIAPGMFISSGEASHSDQDAEPRPKRARATMDYSATKARKRCAIAVGQYLAGCVPQWSFTCKVLAAFEIPRESMSYDAVEFIACDIRRLLTSPVLRRPRKQETEFCRVVRERYEQHCKSDLMPQLLKAVQSGVLSST